MLYNFAQWFRGEDALVLIGRYLLMSLVWWIGIKLSQKKRSPFIWGLTWLWGLISIGVNALMLWALLTRGTGFPELFDLIVSLFVVFLYVALFIITIFYTFSKKPPVHTQKPTEI